MYRVFDKLVLGPSIRIEIVFFLILTSLIGKDLKSSKNENKMWTEKKGQYCSTL